MHKSGEIRTGKTCKHQWTTDRSLKLLVYTRGRDNRDTNPIQYLLVAQGVEQHSVKVRVAGSIPVKDE